MTYQNNKVPIVFPYSCVKQSWTGSDTFFPWKLVVIIPNSSGSSTREQRRPWSPGHHCVRWWWAVSAASPRSIESPHYNPIWHWNRKCFITIPQCPSSSLSVYGRQALNSDRKKGRRFLEFLAVKMMSLLQRSLLESSAAELKELRLWC